MKIKLLCIAVLSLMILLSSCEGADIDGQDIDTTSETADTSSQGDSEVADESETTEDSETTEESETTAHSHTPSAPVKENEIKQTCQKGGEYDKVVYCEECDEEISRETKITGKISHNYKNGKCEYCGKDKPSEGLKFTSYGNGTCAVSGIGSCEDEDIIIPDTSPRGDRVVAIASSAFYNCIGLWSVSIPDTVTSIGDNAFIFCANLEKVTLPDNLSYFGSSVFGDCSYLQCNIENGLGYLGSAKNPYLVLLRAKDKTKTEYETNPRTVFVSSGAFSSCDNATNIVITDSVKHIGSNAFQRCDELKTVTLSKNITVIEDGLFRSCQKLETVNIPSGVQRIGKFAFEFCNSLKKIDLPDGLSSIGEYAFNFCTSLTEVEIPNSVTSIMMCAFENCSSLESVTMPNSISVIPNGMFRNCEKLKNITIPSSVTEIGKVSFENCKMIERIIIPANVRTIGYDAFKNCIGLKGVKFEVTKGWVCYEVKVPVIADFDLTDEAENAIYLSWQHNDLKWKRT